MSGEERTPEQRREGPDRAEKESPAQISRPVGLLEHRDLSHIHSEKGGASSGDDGDDDTALLMMLSSPPRTRPSGPRSGDDGALRERLHARMQQAADRREALQESRRRALAEAEQQRQAKLRQTRELRRRALARFMEQAPTLLLQFEHAGLHFRAGQHTQLNAEVVEQTLVADPVVCEHCAGKPAIHERMCPATKRPHRRSLVLAAEALLRLIGDTRVSLVPPKPEISDTTVVVPKTRTRRGITVIPQLFVLCFYNAVIPDDDPECDLLLRDCAQHLLEVTESIKAALGATEREGGSAAEDDMAYVARLLQSFARAWRQYVRVSEGLLSESTPEARRTAQHELVTATIDGVVSAERRLRAIAGRSASTSIAEPGSEAALLLDYVSLLEARCERIGGPNAMSLLTAARQRVATAPAATSENNDNNAPPTPLTRQSEAAAQSPPARQPPQHRAAAAADHELSPATTPEHHPSRSPPAVLPAAPLPPSAYHATSAGGTSGSDTDTPSGAARVFGPPLPPNWRISERGTSVPPPPPTAEQIAAEKFARLEYRAAQAYRARVRPREYTAPEDEARRALREMLSGAMWRDFAAELSQVPPNLDRVPRLFTAVVDALVEALPRRLRGRTSQEMRDVLDWSVVRHRVRAGHGEAVCGEVTRYVINRVAELGAPARADALRQRLDELLRSTGIGQPLEQVVVAMFQLMFSAVEQLRADIAEFSVLAITDELAGRCVEFQREFLTECLPPVAEWHTTARFLRAGWAAAMKAGAAAMQPLDGHPGRPSLIDGSPAKTALFYGAVELLKSAHVAAETRWALFPKEGLHFDKATIFDCANAVQMCTLRLMLSGTIALVLQPLRLPAQEASTVVKAIDAKLTGEWLGPTAPLSLPALKAAVVEELHFVLNNGDRAGSGGSERNPPASCSPARPRPGEVRSLSATDTAVLHGAIEKMTDTTSMQYITFEGRVTDAVLQHLVCAATGRDVGGVRSLGLANDEVLRVARELRIVLQHNWTVYEPFYCQIELPTE